MAKKYKYITIKENGEFNGKPKYSILNNRRNIELGMLFWYKEWKQYVFTQSQENMIFNNSCLLDIVDFIDTQCG